MNRTLSKSTVMLIGILVLVSTVTIGAGPAYANGAPVDIYLSYLPSISNWGPQDATGHAVVAVGDGEVSLETQGLPRLTAGYYEVWLESRAERKLYSVGKFNADADGIGHLAVLLDTLPYQEYRMLLITVEHDPDSSPDPDPRQSLAGLFPNIVVLQTNELSSNGGSSASSVSGGAVISGSKTTAESAPAAGDRPVYLPVTGGNQVPDVFGWAFATLAALTIAVGIGLIVVGRYIRQED